MRQTMLDEKIGDPEAPVGTRGWLYSVLGDIRVGLKKAETSAFYVKRSIELLQEVEAWKLLNYLSLDILLLNEVNIEPTITAALLNAKKGQTIKEVVHSADQAPPLPKHGEIGNARSRVDIIKSTQGGTSSSYLARRIKRDHPEIFDKLETYKSIRAAALEVGIVKETMTVPRDIDALVMTLRRKLTQEEIIKLIGGLTQ